MNKGVLLDNSFFLRFLNEHDPLFKNADGYYQYFLEKGFYLAISTISIAEYCVRGALDELPLRNLRIVPFNTSHAVKTGEFAQVVFKNRPAVKERVIIPNDSKLFAQADVEITIDFYLSSDTESYKVYQAIRQAQNVSFEFIDLRYPYTEKFGILF